MKIKLDPGAYELKRAYGTDAGLDLCAVNGATIPPNGCAVFDTGVHVQLPKGTAGLLVSKSGLNINADITSTGLIDAGYSGAIKVKLYNHGNGTVNIKAGQKISQLVIIPIIVEPIEVVDTIESGERGDRGFGSSGE